MNQPQEVQVSATAHGINVNTSGGVLIFPTAQKAFDYLTANGLPADEATALLQRVVARAKAEMAVKEEDDAAD